MMKSITYLFLFFSLVSCIQEKKESVNHSDDLYRFNSNLSPRWVSFENSTGAKGSGGMENNGGKGHPSDQIKAGETKIFLDIEGPGIINRMWFTINDRKPDMLRGLVINMYWDGETKPAVSAPFGDFFGVGVGKTAVFDNALFANPEGRSFNSFVQMPFKESAKIEITNETDRNLDMVFYDINLNLMDQWEDDLLYFHCFWQRDTLTKLAEDFEILPKVEGKGRFLGSTISVVPRDGYDAWWGEGEVKIFMNGDTDFPTLIGTGTEDYIGTAWGQGKFHNDFTGCFYNTKHITFYRYHIPDAIYFDSDCKVAIQQMGGKRMSHVRKIQNEGMPMIPVTIIPGPKINGIYEPGKVTDLDSVDYSDDAWVNFYRVDDMAAAAYFYLDKPSSKLPEIPAYNIRTWNLPSE